jgi:sugar-specific transcriptional regulator TrmB
MFSETISNEDVQTLVSLGLTLRQSKVYLILAKMDKASVNNLASVAKIDRANVYRTIKQLQELRLVEKIISNPTAYKALSLKEGVTLLLQSQKKEYKDKQTQASMLVRKYEQKSKINIIEDYQFSLIPSGAFVNRKIVEIIESNKELHEIIVYWQDFERLPEEIVALWSKLLKRGVEIKIIVYSDKKVQLPARYEPFRNLRNIEIRITDKKPQTTLSIYDKKIALLSTTPMISQPMNSHLLMENPTIVGVIQEYFELMWRRAQPI